MTESLSWKLKIFLLSCYCLSFIAETVDCSHKACLFVSATKNDHTDSNLEVCEVTVHELLFLKNTDFMILYALTAHQILTLR